MYTCEESSGKYPDAKCYDTLNNAIEYRNTQSWCCSDYGKGKKYKWKKTLNL
jgi:hypothetical protein